MDLEKLADQFRAVVGQKLVEVARVVEVIDSTDPTDWQKFPPERRPVVLRFRGWVDDATPGPVTEVVIDPEGLAVFPAK